MSKQIEQELQHAIKIQEIVTQVVQELKKKLEESKKPKVWKPNVGDIVWYVENSKNIEPSSLVNESYYNEEILRLWEFGAIFPTKEECEKYIAKTLATQRVLRKLRELEGDWEFELNSETTFTVAMDGHGWGIDETRYVFARPIEWYSSKEAWQYVINNMEADLRLAWGIE